ncbi:hypothetical protein GM418_28975 [Maribellus comscasis]|uniref:Uncharacterized protein n=1 Tax=Maribellus comscasis TaxID=2681766 RepID=A0A6I6K4I3_9BACT|nr:hypothetical protein [Maribellus comscasis]QGY47557.1 hypothetical protein GM418_28975 [Maribellus comscasis]
MKLQLTLFPFCIELSLSGVMGEGEVKTDDREVFKFRVEKFIVIHSVILGVQ